MTNRLEPASGRRDPAPEAAAFGPDAHGIADWPFGAGPAQPWQAHALPDGRPWPRVRILTLAEPETPGLDATRASVRGQAYTGLRHDVVPRDGAAAARLAEAVSDPAFDALLLLRPGDMLAPDAIAALCLAAALDGAEIVAGLRLVFGSRPLGLDAPAMEGPLSDGAAPEGPLAPFTGGEMLLSRALVARAGGFDRDAIHPVAALWPRLAGTGARLARIGRPVLLQRALADRIAPLPPGLSIAVLTDRGYGGGAGIGHRRLAEALTLAGHRITDVVLADESPPAAAEWTERFPRAEARIGEGGFDLVLAGNLHGATRSLGILERLAGHVPVAAILHDLFPLTGRCAFPGDCTVIAEGCDARCPSPTAYPQLAPNRIAAAFADKRLRLTGPRAPLLLANSDWTETIARRLAPAGTRIDRIGLGFPTGVFRPGDRAALRRELGLPAGDVLVMFAAVIADAPGKGAAELAAILRRVAGPGIGFVAVGRLDDPAAFGLPNLVAAGPIGDEDSLARWYGACDIYITASRNETLGQTPVEAALCGTPTVAYRSTGLTTAVIDGVSGHLTEPEPEALEAALRALIADAPARGRLGALGRLAVEGRNSHAAAAMRFEAVLVARGILPADAGHGRIRFAPAMLAHFAMARDRAPGRSGTVPAASGPAIRAARRLKQAVLGRGLPLWLRRGLYAGVRVRAWARSGLGAGRGAAERISSAPARATAPDRIYVDHTHLRSHVTGIERIAIDLFGAGTLRPHPVVPVRATGVARMILAQQIGLPLRALRDRHARVIFPGFPPGPLATLLLGRRGIAYIHDTFLLTRPQDLSWKSRLYMAPSFAVALRFGRCFLVNSRTTGIAVRAFCRAEALVALLRPAVRDVFGLAGMVPAPGPRAGEPLRLLAIGTIEPRKDYPAAIAIAAALNAAGVNTELHVVGRVGWGRHDFLAAPPPFLTLHGYRDDAALRRLAESCHLLLSTSKAEGLGLPLLEVQHGGLPIVAPHGPVFSEVLGASGLFIDPGEPEVAAAAIRDWVFAPSFALVPDASRANVRRWNELAAADAARFARYLRVGASAYADAPDAVVG
ncbi:glycosyltransferase [Methylobacterium sp. J-068]|uniref:glycosyltransferase n=1 Tax=Methylobacterium sp. J-068 TaxID=2836649 RepID=UPI001FBA02FA|nr:glycosyltransferase [Methylobacterium sp. J-068]MCJ2033891.1 glycosyltransferase [Methylobacterium sp. J-068]